MWKITALVLMIFLEIERSGNGYCREVGYSEPTSNGRDRFRVAAASPASAAPFAVPNGMPTKGAAGAKVTLFEFFEFH